MTLEIRTLQVIDQDFDELYQLAADMGGAGFVFSGENDTDIMHNSALINLNVVEKSIKAKVKKIFYSSSACMYPERNQLDPENPNCTEDSTYPAEPDSEYGWEKLFSERFYLAANRNYGLDVRIHGFHIIFLVRKVHGMMEERKLRQHFVEKLQKHLMVGQLKCGVMVNRLGHFYMLMNV